MNHLWIQNEINYYDRELVINLLISLCDPHIYDLNQCTLHLAIILLDKYLAIKIIEKKHFNAIAITCLVIASKTEEQNDIEFCEITKQKLSDDYTYSLTELYKLEHDILEKLNYQVFHETIAENIEVICKQNNCNHEDLLFSQLLSNIILTVPEYNKIKPFELASNIIYFTLILDLDKNIVQHVINTDYMCAYLFYYLKKNYETNNKNLGKIININDSFLKISDISNIILKNKSNNMRISNCKYINIFSNNSIQNIEKISKLGKGTYGTVSKVKINENIFALKTIKISAIPFENGIYSSFLREINSLHLLNHSNIIKMHGIYYDNGTRCMLIAFEVMKCCLHKYIISGKYNLTIDIKKNLIIELLEGVNYMHRNNIMHRDLSVTNILVSESGQIKISDLGSSRFFRHEDYIGDFSPLICSLYFRSIELLLNKTPYSSKIDVWSSACLIAFILDERYLFCEPNEIKMVDAIFKTFGTPTIYCCQDIFKWPKYEKKNLVKLEEKYPSETQILYMMFEYEPNKRITINKTLELFTKIFSGKTSLTF